MASSGRVSVLANLSVQVEQNPELAQLLSSRVFGGGSSVIKLSAWALGSHRDMEAHQEKRVRDQRKGAVVFKVIPRWDISEQPWRDPELADRGQHQSVCGGGLEMEQRG